MSKTKPGNFFEDFRLGQAIRHATPRTVTAGDVALYIALFRRALCAAIVRPLRLRHRLSGLAADDLLVFHIVFGKTVPDISLNAVANLGYADCRFLAPVYPGDTLIADSEVIGLRELSSGKAGVVYVRSPGFNQEAPGARYVRWVMVRKRDEAAPARAEHVPDLPELVEPEALGEACPRSRYGTTISRSPHRRIASAIIRSARRSTISTA